MNVVKKTPRAYRGFTLIELMMVIVIVAILVGIALPSYQGSVRKGNRSDAKAALMDVANRQEQLMLDRNRYTENMVELGYGQDPMISQDEHYTVDAENCDGGAPMSCYVLTATPRAPSPQTDDTACTTLTLDSNGARGATGTAADECW